MTKKTQRHESLPESRALQKALREPATAIHNAPVLAPAGGYRRLAALCQTEGPGAPRELPLDLEETVIGRSLQAHVCIDSGLISRRHMSVKRNGGQFEWVDLDSANGVYLNGLRAHSSRLHDGDTLQLGDVMLVFRRGG